MKQFLAFLLIIVTPFILLAQDPLFSQFTSSRLNTNPAFAGTDSSLVLSSGYRAQWPKISGGYRTFYFSADQYFCSLRGGIGLNFLNDNEMNGTLTSSKFAFIYSLHLQLFNGKLILRPAIEASYAQKKIDFANLTFGDMIDARRGFDTLATGYPKSTKSYFDLSTGLLLYTKNFHFSASLSHLTTPDVGFLGPAPLPRKLTLHTGFNFNINSLFSISPNVLFMKQSSFNTYTAGINLGVWKFLIGLNYRRDDALITNIGFKNRLFKICYSFDYPLYNITLMQSGGSHELQLLFYVNYPQKRKLTKIVSLL